jgi:hypothetical protein
MSAQSSVRVRRENSSPQAEFLALSPIVERHARVAFRGRNRSDREEAIAEALAAAFQSYAALKARGKDPIRDFPTVLATFAVLHVKDDRHVGGRSSSQDVLSRKAQRKHDFRIESLPSSPRARFGDLYGEVDGQGRQDTFEERLQADTQTPVPDQVCFRIDWPAFLQTLSPRDQAMARFLSLGHSGQAAAKKFKVCPGRVTQLRRQWHRAWLAFQGEPTANP